MNRRSAGWMGAMLMAAMLAGCAASSGHRAPIIDQSFNSDGSHVSGSSAYTGSSDMMPIKREAMQHDKDWRPQKYVVQPGDTLYSIAFNFGFDYHDLAELNGIRDPSMIHAGEEIRLFARDGTPAPGLTKAPEVNGPKSVKLPYSRQAVTQVQKGSSARHVPVTTVSISGNGPVHWGIPTRGTVVAGFSESDNRKGIDIAGKRGQPIAASAAGKVVYCGSGLRGYGKLVIIKHNSTYLSAYAHNEKLLVKEGQTVTKGQEIAEMGSSDASRVELHFEIRKLGRPVDPAKYLPLPKS